MTDTLVIKYRTAHKAIPPQPIKPKIPGWAGSAELKMEDGSEPQPWHCHPFVDGATYGLELVYQYDSECKIINDNGEIRIQWDHANEPGGIAGPDEFGLNAPKPIKFYSFGTSLDLQAPPGYVLRTQTHPRYYTDDTGTVPNAVPGHVQSEWWPKKLFVVFKVPWPGQGHVFRKGEPYVQVLFVPQRLSCEPARMTPEEENRRRELDEAIFTSNSYVARNVWHNPVGSEFNDHYKVLARAFAREGMIGVESTVRQALRRKTEAIPAGKSPAQYLELATCHVAEGRFLEAWGIYEHLSRIAPRSAVATSEWGRLADSMGLEPAAIRLLSRAASLEPRSAMHHYNLGEVLRRASRFPEAEASFRTALRFSPEDPLIQSSLGLTLAERGRGQEGLAICQSAARPGPYLPLVLCRMAQILVFQGEREQARIHYDAAVNLDPSFAPALEGLRSLIERPANSGDPQPTSSSS